MSGESWAVEVPRRLRSAAVIVGTASHTAPGALRPIPQVAANVRALADALTGAYGLFDPSRVRTRVDPERVADVLDLMPTRDGGRLDLCLFYYAGHGLLAEGDRLCLALPGSVDEPARAARSSLPVDDVLAALDHTKARHRVAILDCCFSGRALDSPAAADVHLLTATSRTKRARYGTDAEYTGFTGELLRLLADGVPDGPDHLDLALLHRRLSVALPTAAEPCPVPAQRTVGRGGDLALTRNPAHGTGRTRPGLAARAQFALRVRQETLAGAAAGRPERLTRAVRLFADIADDGERAFGAADPDVLAYRHAYASLMGEAGDVSAAARLLEAVVADAEAAPPPGGARLEATASESAATESAAPPGGARLEAARASLAHWRTRATEADPLSSPAVRPPPTAP
ncbi:caspase family protein [Streptomyces sp. NPDC048639]|uniref:caspase, EACC1-associated type n=1 Tax=Streptomyces sp. NPDC048639 TaxID=3365581 RepID=UPI0037168F93